MEKKYDHLTSEAAAQKLWEQQNIYSAENNPGPLYSIDTPPPTVSGSLHIGHIFSYTQTDIIARYARMQGNSVFYPFGFDDNGLPTEKYVEKKLDVRAHEMKRSEFKEGMTVKLTKLLQPCDHMTEGKEYKVLVVFDDGISVRDDDKDSVFTKWEHLEKLYVYEPVSYRTVTKLELGQILYWYDSYVDRTDTFEVESITYNKDKDYTTYNFKAVGDSYLQHNYVFQIELDRWVEGGECFHFSLDSIKPIKIRAKKEKLAVAKRQVIKLENELTKLENEL